MNGIPRRRPSAVPALSDAQALHEMALGRVSALAVIYDRHRSSLYRFFANATGYAEDVEDLVQATFMTAARAAASFDGRESCRAWLIGIGASLLSRRRRTLARWGHALREFTLNQESRRADVERQLVARGELNAVARALSSLSEKKRVVLLLADLEEMPGEEIAQALQVPIGTVWTRLHHARRELREQLIAEDKRS